MRHDVYWVQRTYDALNHLHENIAQPIIFRGYDTKDKMWREFVLSPKQTVNDVSVMHVYLQRLDPRSVIALTDFVEWGYRRVGQPIGMHKPLNRVGDAYGWPYVRYSLLQPIVGRFMQPEWR